MNSNAAKIAVSVLSACALTAATTMQAEGWKNDPYLDSTGTLTVCNGETHNVQNRHYSDTECLQMFLNSLVSHTSATVPCLPDDLPVGVRAAFADVSYNLGSAGFCKSSMATKAKAGDLPGACAAISLYVFSQGKDCRIASSNCYGLVIRRASERKQCEDGLK